MSATALHLPPAHAPFRAHPPRPPSCTFSFLLSLPWPCWVLRLSSPTLPYFRDLLSYAAFAVKERDLVRPRKRPRWAWGLKQKQLWPTCHPRVSDLTDQPLCFWKQQNLVFSHFPLSHSSTVFTKSRTCLQLSKGPAWNSLSEITFFVWPQIKSLIEQEIRIGCPLSTKGTSH